MPFKDSVTRSLDAADGYAQLGMWSDGLAELDQLSADEGISAPALSLRLAIYVGLQRWEECALLAQGMVRGGSEAPAAYLLGAYALRRWRSLAEAEAFLRQGEKVLNHDATFHFNLACYACQLGNISEARARLQIAYELDPALRERAAEEEDLQPLRKASLFISKP